ncbi:MAG: acetate/propionate family kinase [Acidimicrobiales bacterium]
MNVLVVNAGSSSLKLRLLDESDGLVASSDLPHQEAAELAGALEEFLRHAPDVGVAGHRVVHGGSKFIHPVLLDDRADATLEALADLAPLHNPLGLAAIHSLRSLRPDLPQVACFDTTFHAGMPAKASTYAIPRAWREQWGIRRYGFHGLSHEWASTRAAELLGRPREELRLVTAHLGAGASLAAVASGRSVDTTMGFTPMEGLVMATRSGTVDPGLVLWVQRHGGLSADQVQEALEHESGLRGLWGESGDLREVMAAMDEGDRDAELAYEVYAYRIQTGVAAMGAAMGGIDGLVFTGGAGEATPRLRADVCAGLGFLGLALDGSDNLGCRGDGLISPSAELPAVLVVRAREDLVIARHVRELIG